MPAVRSFFALSILAACLAQVRFSALPRVRCYILANCPNRLPLAVTAAPDGAKVAVAWTKAASTAAAAAAIAALGEARVKVKVNKEASTAVTTANLGNKPPKSLLRTALK